jgi:hypothetical protein
VGPHYDVISAAWWQHEYGVHVTSFAYYFLSREREIFVGTKKSEHSSTTFRVRVIFWDHRKSGTPWYVPTTTWRPHEVNLRPVNWPQYPVVL